LLEEEDVVERPRSPTPHPQLDPVAAGLKSTAAEVDSAAVKRDLMVVKLDSTPAMVDLVVGELESVGGDRIGSNGASLLCKEESERATESPTGLPPQSSQHSTALLSTPAAGARERAFPRTHGKRCLERVSSGAGAHRKKWR
jgi:hypothetical protein